MLGLLRRLFAAVGQAILMLGPAGWGRAYGPLSFWFIWDWVIDHYYHPRPAAPGSCVKCCLLKHRGPPLKLADGTTIEPGDRIAEIHLDNRAISQRLAAAGRSAPMAAWAWVTMRGIAEGLEALARPGILGPEVKAVHGVTLLGRGSRRLGFEVFELPRTLINDLTQFYLKGILIIYNPEPERRAELARRRDYPASIWLSRRALEERYGKRKSLSSV